MISSLSFCFKVQQRPIRIYIDKLLLDIIIVLCCCYRLPASLMNRSLRRIYKGKKEHRKAAYICIFSTPSNFVSLSSPSSFGCSLSLYTNDRQGASFPAFRLGVFFYSPFYRWKPFYFPCSMAIDRYQNGKMDGVYRGTRGSESLPILGIGGGLEKKLINAAGYIYNIV